MRIKRLRISQQLLLLFFIGILIPLCVTALIVTNVNQHAVRAELRYSALITTDSVYQRLEKSIEEKKSALLYIAKSTDYLNNKNSINSYIADIVNLSEEIISIELLNKDYFENKTEFKHLFNGSDLAMHTDNKNNSLVMYVKLKNNKILKEQIDINKLKSDLFKYIVNDKRQVYIIDSKKEIIMSYNEDKEVFRSLLPYLPNQGSTGTPVLFGNIKNQPNVYLKLKNPDWAIIVATPKQLTHYGIIDARYKILAAIVISGIAIIVFGALYSLSLNINLKQLFKAVNAIAKGNYRRKVRMIKDFFTPYEIVYLMEKFNDMAQKVDESYMELQEANIQLSKIDKLKSNLIDTVSHEFRTPLTCIKGYASRLLRNDINLNDDMKTKSLKVIKQQTEQLGRLVDDLLVIPEIESSLLRIFPDQVDLKDIFEGCILTIQQKQQRTFDFVIEKDFPFVWADADRVGQIILNLLDNAVKYSPKDSEIKINVFEENENAVIKIKNKCEKIDETKLSRLFDKFSRLEEDLTRKTRGTGLGLFIVKGLIKAMNGDISLSAKDGFEVRFTLPISK